MSINFSEYDKLRQNTNKANNNSLETEMPDNIIECLEYEDDKRKVILEFPRQAYDTSSIHKEVKEILSSELREQIARLTRIS